MQKYISKLNLEKKKSNFFSSTNETSIAIDDSGSTEGEIMETQKEILTSILSNTNCKQLLNNILCWDNICTINPINRIQSGGLTEPSCIFKKLDKNVKNLLITTDGEIKDEEVNKTRDIINNFKNLKNIICILFQDEEKSPCELNIAVFYPFLEHTKKMQGVFYLFYYKSHNVYLLMKNTPQFFNDNKMFKDPPLEYDETIKWEDIPKYKYNEINKIEVISDETNDGTLFMSKNNQILYLKSLENLWGIIQALIGSIVMYTAIYFACIKVSFPIFKIRISVITGCITYAVIEIILRNKTALLILQMIKQKLLRKKES